jgi:ATP-binding cassette subfamily B protein
VLENGKIVDQGNHDLLISRPGRYRDLCERQLIRGA